MTSRKVAKANCKQLPTVVRNHIRTGFVVNSIGQCIEELVCNAIDAGATKVELEVDFARFNLTFEDNGNGISKEDFEMIGKRYATSKCSSLEDLKSLKFYGYRGEALSSIIDCSTLVEVITRSGHGGHVYRRMFTQAVRGQIEKRSSSEKDNSGVKISITNLMGNYPVRQNIVKKPLEIVDIKDKLEKIALINPNLAIVFKDSENKKVSLLEILATDSILSSFKQFLKFKHHHLIEVHQSHSVYNFNAVISAEDHNTKDYQLVYINRKPIPRHKLHRTIHQYLINGIDSRKNAGNSNSSGKSDKYPVFVVNIESPYDEYDITLDPHKSIVEFKHLDKLIAGVEAMVGKYRSLLERESNGGSNPNAERIILKRAKSFAGLRKNKSSSALASINKPFYNQADINLHDIKGSIRSRVAVKTKAPETIVHDDDMEGDAQSKSSTKSVSHAAKSIASWRGKNHNSSSSSPSTSSNHSQDRKITSKSKRNPQASAKRKVYKLKDVKDRISRPNTIGSIPLSLQSMDLANKIKNEFPVFRDLKAQPTRGKKRIYTDNDGDNSNERGEISESPPLVPLASSKRPRNDKICESIAKLSVSRVSSSGSLSGSSADVHKKRRVDSRRQFTDIEEDEEKEMEMEINSNKSSADGSEKKKDQDRAMMPSNKQQISNSQSLMLPTTFTIKDKSNKSSLDTTSSTTPDKERASTHLAYYTKIAEEKCKSLQHKELTNQIKKIVKAHMEANKCNFIENDDKFMEFGNADMVVESENSQRSQYFMSQSRKNDVFPGLDQTNTCDEIPKIPFSTVKKNKTSSPISLPFQNKITTTTGKTAEVLFKSKLPHSISFPNRRVEGAFGFGNKTISSINMNQNQPTTSDYFRPPQNISYKPQPRPTIIHEQQDLFKYLKHDEGVGGLKLNETFVIQPQQSHSSFLQIQQRLPLVEQTLPLPPSTSETESKVFPAAIKSSLNKMINSILENSASATSLASSSKWGNNTTFRLSEPWERPISNELPIANLNGSEICLWKKDRSFKFSKEDLSQVQVVAQFDYKFIVSKIRAGDNYMLVLFDQHAVHERIRLEDHIKQTQIDGKIISCEINPPVELNFTDNQLHIIISYGQKFENVGIKILSLSNGLLRINGIPKPFLQKALVESNANRGIVVQKLVHSLIEEVCDNLFQTRGVETDTMPKTILTVLQSIACHGAIKFGDLLSIKQCEELLYKLQFCQAPFQCAHGRPVIFPLIELDDNLQKFANSDIKEKRRVERKPGGSQSNSQSQSQSQQDYITSPFFWENPETSNITGIEIERSGAEDQVEVSSKYFSNQTTNDNFKLF